MSRLHMRASRWRLLQDAVGRQRFHIARVADHNRQTGVGKNVLGVGKRLLLDIWNGHRLAMMGVDVDGEARTPAHTRHHYYHGEDVAPEIRALQLSEKL